MKQKSLSLFLLCIVAKEPLNLIPLWKTDTSLLINWNVPSVVPIGYVIFYKLAHDDNRQSVMVNGSKESHVLEGLRMDNMYNISMLSLSEHLPSALVGSPILSGILILCFLYLGLGLGHIQSSIIIGTAFVFGSNHIVISLSQGERSEERTGKTGVNLRPRD